MKRVLLTLALAAGMASAQAQKFEGLALTPQMGWNSWNKFACDIDEELVRETADALVETGLAAAGYVYINLDDCWHAAERDADGFIQCDADRFPSGIAALADYVHERGLKLGIYSDAGRHTCGGRLGSFGHEYQDALQYARWGVDYLKYDWCETENINARGAYTLMRDALYAAGRPILFSMCEWGDNKPWEWAADVAHSWRTTGDIWCSFDEVLEHGTWRAWSVMHILDMTAGLRRYAGPGHWNDPDMLEVGNGKLTYEQNKSHFSLWCMMNAPLILGNDLRCIKQDVLDIVTNKNLISINQDPLGKQAKLMKKGSIDILAKPLSGNRTAICLFNSKKGKKQASVDLQTLVNDKYVQMNHKNSYTLTEQWTGETVETNGKFKTELDGYSVKVYIV